MNIGSSQDKNYNYGVFIKDIIEWLDEDIDKDFQIVNDPSIASLINRANRFQNYFRNVDEREMTVPPIFGFLLNDPEFLELMKNFYSNPNFLQFLSQNEEVQKIINKEPYAKYILENPDDMLQLLIPENIQLLSNIFSGNR